MPKPTDKGGKGQGRGKGGKKPVADFPKELFVFSLSTGVFSATGDKAVATAAAAGSPIATYRLTGKSTLKPEEIETES
jgi:hypothetical protein